MAEVELAHGEEGGDEREVKLGRFGIPKSM